MAHRNMMFLRSLDEIGTESRAVLRAVKECSSRLAERPFSSLEPTFGVRYPDDRFWPRAEKTGLLSPSMGEQFIQRIQDASTFILE